MILYRIVKYITILFRCCRFFKILKIIKKYLLLVLGFMLLALGIAGYVLPGLPGTIFLILAATCFVKSNKKMYDWITGHKIFGKVVKDYLDTGKMPLKAKILSITFIWIFTTISIIWSPYGIIFLIAVVTIAAIGTLFILTRPTKH
tara:strand:- start:153 stop:590 length:438 start_codon:yes stop_codon:yes gene_type:complete